MTALSRAGILVAALWRPAWLSAILEIPLLAAVSALVIFFVALPLKAPLDSMSYELRAAYERSVRLPPGSELGGGVSVDVASGFPVAPAPGPGGSLAFTPDLVRLDLHVTADLEAYLRQVAGSNVVTRTGGAGGLLDEDSALRMHVAPGDDVVLLVSNVVDAPPIVVRVAGLVRPPSRSTDDSSSGLFVLGATDLPPWFVVALRGEVAWPSVTKSRLVYDPAEAAGLATHSRSDAIGIQLATLFNPLRLAALAGVLASAVALWAAVMIRSFGHAVGRLRGRCALLAALGAAPRQIGLAGILPEVTLAMIGLALGAVAIAQLTYPLVLRRTLQGPTIGFAVGPMIVLLAIVAVIRYRSLSRDLAGSTIVAELSAEEA